MLELLLILIALCLFAWLIPPLIVVAIWMAIFDPQGFHALMGLFQ